MIVKVKVVFEDGSSVPAMIRLRGAKQFPKPGRKREVEGSAFKRAWGWIQEKMRKVSSD